MAIHTRDGVWQGTPPATEEVVSKEERRAEPDFDITSNPGQLTLVRMLPKHRLNTCLHCPFLHGSLLDMYLWVRAYTLTLTLTPLPEVLHLLGRARWQQKKRLSARTSLMRSMAPTSSQTPASSPLCVRPLRRVASAWTATACTAVCKIYRNYTIHPQLG